MKVKSINVKSVFGKVSKANIGEVLFNVAGHADELLTIETKYGENVGLKGDFVAVNAQTGEVFESNAAFLPSNLTDSIVAKIKESPNTSIEFKASVELAESDKNDKGYTNIAEAPLTHKRG